MKTIFSLVTFTAAAIFLAVFLSSLPGERLLGLSPAKASAHASDRGCRLQGPLLANGQNGLDPQARQKHV